MYRILLILAGLLALAPFAHAQQPNPPVWDKHGTEWNDRFVLPPNTDIRF